MAGTNAHLIDLRTGKELKNGWLDDIIDFNFGTPAFLTIVATGSESTLTGGTPSFHSGIKLQASNGKIYSLVSQIKNQPSSAVITQKMLALDVFTANQVYSQKNIISAQPGVKAIDSYLKTQCVFINLAKFPKVGGFYEFKLITPAFRANHTPTELWWTAYPHFQTDGVTVAAPHNTFQHNDHGVIWFDQQAAVNYTGSFVNFIDAEVFSTEAAADALIAANPGLGPWTKYHEYVGTRWLNAGSQFAIGTYTKALFPPDGVFKFPIDATNADSWATFPVGYTGNPGADLNLGYGSTSGVNFAGNTTTLVIDAKTKLIKFP